MIFITTLFMLFILLIRRPDVLFLPQFWAEDGTVFFAEAYLYGIKSLVIPYNGYLHLIPRLVAFPASLFDPLFAPAIYAYCSIALTLFVGGYICNKRLELPYKPVLALFIVFIPQFNFRFTSISNIHWFLDLLILLLFLQNQPQNNRQRFSDYTILFLASLSDPIIIFACFFFIFKLIREKTRHNLILCGISILCALTQTFFALQRYSINQLDSASAYISDNLIQQMQVLGYKLFGWLVLGEDIKMYFTLTEQFVMMLVFILFIVLAARRNRKIFQIVLAMLAYGFVFLFASILKAKMIPLPQRFYIIPHIMLIWSLIVSFKPNKRIFRIIIIFFLLAILRSSVKLYFFKNCPCACINDFKWAAHSKLINKGRPISIPINPEDWFIKLP